MFCEKCGNKLDRGDRFCPVCGNPVDEAEDSLSNNDVTAGMGYGFRQPATEKRTAAVCPDVIEILPGLMPKVIRRICQTVRRPVIAGGLISEKEDIMAALKAGAAAISTTNQQVWFM